MLILSNSFLKLFCFVLRITPLRLHHISGWYCICLVTSLISFLLFKWMFGSIELWTKFASFFLSFHFFGRDIGSVSLFGCPSMQSWFSSAECKNINCLMVPTLVLGYCDSVLSCHWFCIFQFFFRLVIFPRKTFVLLCLWMSKHYQICL